MMDAVYVVVAVASKDGLTEHWAAQGTAGQALADVRRYLPSGWFLTLTGEMLSAEEADALGIRPGNVRRLSRAAETTISHAGDIDWDCSAETRLHPVWSK
jgi:hypothetical protein